MKKEKYDGVVKLGTYGVISGAKYYLVAACEKKDFAYEALGYTFEKAILYCTSLLAFSEIKYAYVKLFTSLRTQRGTQ